MIEKNKMHNKCVIERRGNDMSLLRSINFTYLEEERFRLECGMILSEIPENELKKYQDYLGELADGVMAGRIDTTRIFHMKAYVNGIKENQNKHKAKKSQKILSIYEDELEEDASIPPCCVPISALQTSQSAGEVAERNLELQEAVNELRHCNLKIAARESVDVITAMIASTRNTGKLLKASQKLLNQVVVKYPEIGNSIEIMLSSGYQIDELFPEEVKQYDSCYKTHRNDLGDGYLVKDDCTSWGEEDSLWMRKRW